MNTGISIVLPAYKEEENLKVLLPRLNASLSGMDYEIIVVDSQQPKDRTDMVCMKNHCIYAPRTGGENYGDAVRTGIKRAGKKYMVIMDADGSHNPDYIVAFYEKMQSGKYDLVIGSRYCQGGGTHNPLILKAMSKMLNISYKVVFHLPVNDVSNSFRMYKTKQIKKLDLKCQNFDIVEEILILLNVYKKNLRIKEVPIIFHERAYGKSKRDLVRFVFSYLSTMRRLLKRQKAAKKRRNIHR